MKIYSEKQIDVLRESGQILRGAFEAVKKEVKAGISTFELDKIAEDYIRSKGGEPCFKNHQGYGFSICASVNEESIHGKPRKDRFLKDGDIISVDCGVRYPKGKGGMCTDAARTFAVGNISTEAKELIDACEKCFKTAVDNLKAGDKVSVIGERIEKFIDGRYGIIDTYFGHGIGETLHEEPLVPNFNIQNAPRGIREKLIKLDIMLPENAIICIEPMINCGTKDIKVAKDGWTVVTADGRLAAHYENTVIVRKNGTEIVT